MSILSPVLGMRMTLQSGSQQLVKRGGILVGGPMPGVGKNIKCAGGMGGEKKLANLIEPRIDSGVFFSPDSVHYTARFFQVARE